jgi:hypothetical protein
LIHSPSGFAEKQREEAMDNSDQKPAPGADFSSAAEKPVKSIDDRIRDGEFFKSAAAESRYYAAWHRTGIKPVIK